MAIVKKKLKLIDRFRGQYYFLSNFYPSYVEFDGEKYPTVEHAYQAAKTKNKKIRAMIRRQQNPGDAKRLTKEITIRKDWDQVKYRIMYELLVKKFSIRYLANRLKATGSAELVEGNTWGDTYWGVCDGVGENKLGKLLMHIREVIIL